MSTPLDKERSDSIEALRNDAEIQRLNRDLVMALSQKKYTYNFDWLGVPMIQCPQDVVALQEIIWRTRPDVILEAGVAYGGSLVFLASMLRLLGNGGKVIGVDIEIKPENRAVIEGHFLSSHIHLVEGSSTNPAVVDAVKQQIPAGSRVMVILDSDHTHAHVRAELECYAPCVTPDCYLVVMDSVIEDLPAELFAGKRWGKGNNPKTALHDFIKVNKRFVIDSQIDGKLVMTVAPDGFLRCVGP